MERKSACVYFFLNTQISKQNFLLMELGKKKKKKKSLIPLVGQTAQ